MLHILLTILKIIGIILLAILGLLILLLCIVFFVPLRYEIIAETKGDLKTTKLELKFSWLLHLIAGQVTYLEEELDYKIRVLWKKITETEPAEKPAEEVVDEVSEEQTEKPEEESPIDSSESLEEAEATDESVENTAKVDEKEEKVRESKFQKIKCTIKEVCVKIKMVLEFLKGETHKLTLSRIKKEIVRLFVSLKPKKLRGKIRFGMDDPYKTGQILAALSILYPIYGGNVEIFPEFDQKVLEGDVYVKGHIRGILAVRMLFNLIIDKNVRTTIKDIKALFENN